MNEQPSMGMNRTGVQMSLFDTGDMQSVMPAFVPPPIFGDGTALAGMRSSYIAEAAPIGSMPLPGTMKGMVSAGTSLAMEGPAGSP